MQNAITIIIAYANGHAINNAINNAK